MPPSLQTINGRLLAPSLPGWRGCTLSDIQVVLVVAVIGISIVPGSCSTGDAAVRISAAVRIHAQAYVGSLLGCFVLSTVAVTGLAVTSARGACPCGSSGSTYYDHSQTNVQSKACTRRLLRE